MFWVENCVISRQLLDCVSTAASNGHKCLPNSTQRKQGNTISSFFYYTNAKSIAFHWSRVLVKWFSTNHMGHSKFFLDNYAELNIILTKNWISCSFWSCLLVKCQAIDVICMRVTFRVSDSCRSSDNWEKTIDAHREVGTTPRKRHRLHNQLLMCRSFFMLVKS